MCTLYMMCVVFHSLVRREAMVRSYPYSTSEPAKKGLRGLFSKKKKKKIYYQNTPPSSKYGVVIQEKEVVVSG